jgi:membrane associated rhomboid family serine protease
VKLGIPLLVIGVALLIISIPFSILSIIGGVTRLTQGNVSGGVLAYAGIVGVVVGLVMTAIGAIRVFKR